MNPKRIKPLIALLFVGVLMGALDLALIGPALPAIKAEFGMNDRQLSVLFNAYVLCQMIGAPLLAKASDRFGPRVLYIFSIACFAFGSLLLVITGEVAGLIWGRAIQGFGAGGIFPVASAVVGNQLPERERGPTLGLLGTVFGLAFLLGPVIGGIFLRYSWHWLFLINIPIALLLIGGAMTLLPKRSQGEPKPFDLGGSVTLTIALTAFVLAVNSLDTDALLPSLGSWPVAGGFALVAAMLPAFWIFENRAVDPIIRPGFFRSRQIISTCAIATGVGALQAGGVFYPALAVSALGVTQSQAAWLMLPGVVASTVTSPVAGRLINVIGTRIIISTSLVFVTVSVLIYGLAHLSIVSFVTAGLISGVGLAGLLGAPLRFIVLDESAPSERGAAQGLLSVFMSVGRLAGAAGVGTIAASRGGGTVGYQSAFVGMAFITGLLVLVATTLKSKSEEHPRDTELVSDTS